jgi:MSHA biogenesis protein MshE
MAIAPTPQKTSKTLLLGAALLQHGLVTQEKLDEALAENKRTGRMLGRVLLDMGIVTEEQIARAMSTQLGVPYVDLRRYEINPDTVKKLTEVQARRFRAVILEERSDTFVVGMVDPTDLRAQDELSLALKRPIEVAMITNDQLVHTIDRVYRRTEQITEYAREVERDIEVVDLNAMSAQITDEDAPVVRLLQTVFDDAAKAHASDIHIEPQEKKLIVRFRIDGVLHVQAEADPRIASALMVRLKLMAGLDIAEKRLPQDGRIAVRTGSHKMDVRMSTMPTQYGESVVLRLLMQSSGPIDLQRSGMPAEIFQRFDKAIHAAHGIVLVTGPTGSGKTTTLYGALQRLNEPSVKILTCEDPVEYRIAGLNQVQVNEKIDLGFARVLRSFLRQDPDILLVGEIRDEETASIATRAAMTGHLVLSTLHTNDAITTPGRLLDMGIKGYMVASTLLAVMAQRLVRVNCNYCAKPYVPTPDELEWVKHFMGEEIDKGVFRMGRGCSRCNGIGYSGRMGVYEFLEMTEPLASAVHHEDAPLFESEGRKQMAGRTLGHSALTLALAGKTTIEEAMKVASSAEA